MPALEQMKQMLLPLRLYILSPESRVYAELCAYAQGLEAAQQRLDQLMEAAFIQTARQTASLFGSAFWASLRRAKGRWSEEPLFLPASRSGRPVLRGQKQKACWSRQVFPAPCKRIARQQRSACALEAAQSALRFVRRWSCLLYTSPSPRD